MFRAQHGATAYSPRHSGFIRAPDEPHGDAGGCESGTSAPCNPQEPPMSSATSSQCRDRSAATTWPPSTTLFISWATSGGAIFAHRERPRVDGVDAKRERIRRTLNPFFPRYMYPATQVYLGRIYDVFPLLPVASSDRSKTTVGRVWIGRMDTQPLRPNVCSTSHPLTVAWNTSKCHDSIAPSPGW